MKTLPLSPEGHLILPPEWLARYGLLPGGQVQIEETPDGFRMTRSPDVLAQVYVEPTNLCNLDCSTCMRNVWDEPLGRMAPDTFERVLAGVRAVRPAPGIFFGGFGEPLAHPAILEMVRAAKKAAAWVELITNGILLNEAVARALIAAGLDRLWVSIDGATPQSYADVRLGDALPLVLENLARLKDLRAQSGADRPRLGIAFVAMRRNLADLPEVVRLGKRLGADQFSISNVLPHTPELQEQILYAHSMHDSDLQPSPWEPVVALPRIDIDELTLGQLAAVLKGRNHVQFGGQPLDFGAGRCPFVRKGSLSVRWDGAVSPCLPLLHTHHSYLGNHLRTSHAYAVGRLDEHSLSELWNAPAYRALRERLRTFDFSPCTFCNSCEMSEANLEDCFGSLHPTCGGCLWGQGFIQCP